VTLNTVSHVWVLISDKKIINLEKTILLIIMLWLMSTVVHGQGWQKNNSKIDAKISRKLFFSKNYLLCYKKRES
jgi:hypothetical protein